MKTTQTHTETDINKANVIILIIDHTRSNTDELSTQLGEDHYNTIVAYNSHQGLIAAQHQNPNLILLNASIPNIDGYDTHRLLSKLRETRNIPIILILEEPEIHNFSTSSTNIDYITKPFCKTDIKNRIERNLKTSNTISVPKDSISKEHNNDELSSLLIKRSPDAILVEHQGAIIFANPTAISLYHAESEKDLLGRPLLSLTAPESYMHASIAFQEIGNLHRIHHQEEKAQLLDGQTCDVNITRLHFEYKGDQAIQMVARDISKRKQLDTQLHYQATHDTVTGLPNRSLFTDRLAQSIDSAKQDQSELLVCFIDLDRFKRINDSMGHETGDQLLICVADRITSCIRTTDTVARMGGDEFVLLLPFSGDKKNGIAVIERVLSEVSEPIFLENQSFTITCSIGYSHYPADGDSGTKLLKYADAAMYHAKECGRNTIQHYNATLQALAEETEKLEQALNGALTNNEFTLQYQIQAEIQQGRITGMEALIRWNSPKLGFVSPARFIPLAEQIGLIDDITEWILKTVCRQSKRWQQQGCKVVPIAVNISAKTLREPQWLESLVVDCLKEFQLDPTLLELEFTESASMDDPETIIPLMLKLKNLGIRLAIDDFGTGYSNLHYLKQFPIDKLKLDGSFVHEITTESRSLAIADAIITMAHRLNLTVIAEMVETKEQLQLLFKHECDQIQGYYFSKPLPNNECAELLDGRLMSLPYPAGSPK